MPDLAGSVDEPSDALVIERSLDRPGEFGAIFDRHASALRRYLVRRLGPVESDDVLGEVFRIAFERRATYDISRPSARPWLYGIATNLVARHHRREARRLRAVARLAAERVGTEAVDDDVAQSLLAEGRWAMVAAALVELPAVERDAIVLHAWEGLGYEQIALATGVPIGTVRSRLHRARGRLHAAIDAGPGPTDADRGGSRRER